MVKLTGPGLGGRASGSLAGDLTFSNWKGKAHLKRKPKPKQPNSPAQIAMRAMMAFLSNQWQNLSTPQKATWQQLAAETNISPINAYLGHNLQRWRNYRHPSQTYPPAETGDIANVAGHWLTGGVRCIEAGFQITALKQAWAMGLHVHPPGVGNENWDNLRDFIPITAIGWPDTMITPVEPGLHWVCFHQFTTTGRALAPNIWVATTVTD